MTEQKNTSYSSEELSERFPDTLLNYDNQYFYAGWLNKQLVLNRCRSCGHWHHPSRPICPKCWSFDIEHRAVSGEGKIRLHMNYYQGPPAPGVDYSEPHPVVTVELAEQEGLRVTSTLIHCPLSEIEIGMPVQLAWVERYDAPYPVFTPVSTTVAEGQ